MFKNKLFYFFDARQKKIGLILIICMLIASLLELIGLSLIFPIAGLFLNSSTTINNLIISKFIYFFDVPSNEIMPYVLSLFLIFYILKTFFLIWYTWFENKFLFSFQENLSSNLFKKYTKQNFNYFYNRNSAEFLRNVLHEVSQFSVYLMAMSKFLLEVVILFGIVSFLIYINWFLTLVVISIFFSVTFIYFSFFKEKLNNWGLLRQTADKRRIQFMQESFDGLKNIKVLSREDFFFNKFKKHNLDLYSLSSKVSFLQNLPRLIFELLTIFSVIVIFFILFKDKTHLAQIIQLLVVYVAASFKLMPSVNRILGSLQLMKFNWPSVNILFNEYQNFKEEDKQNLTKKIIFKKEILVDIKNFKHNKDSKFEVKNIKFTISKGQKIGLIGRSGAGKSSLVDILLGVFKPNEGDVKIDGTPIFSNLKGWQNLIGYVPQKIIILDDNLRNNILFGLSNETYKDTAICKLIEKMNLQSLLSRLPNGLDGTLDEKGINLSGGEIQRIGICRALIYDPQILFLDEATSSLDTFTESQILEEIKNFKDKTIVSIAHRINTLRNCHKIYHVENGTIVDSGDFNKFNPL